MYKIVHLLVVYDGRNGTILKKNNLEFKKKTFFFFLNGK